MLSSGAPPGPMPGGAPPIPGGPGGPAPIGPVTQVQPKPGNITAAAAKVKNAIGALQEALPDLPMGSELHTAVLDAAKSLSKQLGGIEVSPAAQTQARIEDVRRAQAEGPMAALQRLGGGGGAAPGGPPGPAMVA